MDILQKNIRNLFQENFGQESFLVRAPGRINLIGEHTDYNLGFVLPAAIDKQLYFAMGNNTEATLCIKSLNYQNEVIINPANCILSAESSWKRYFEAMTLELTSRGYRPEGVHAVFGGDIPIGAGLSSSAALCCGFIFGLSELLHWNIPREEIALIAQATEHRVELNCGLMDQYAVLFGKADEVICLDCRDLTFRYFPLKLDGYKLVLIDSQVIHELAADSGYNQRRASCENVVGRIAKDISAVQSLRDIDEATLAKYQSFLDPIDLKRAFYVLKENQRVLEVMEALEKGDIFAVGQRLFASHDGLQHEYEVTTPELDFLVTQARIEKNILGARMVGGGFGGCTLNLMREENWEEVIQRICEAYQKKTQIQATFHEVSIRAGIDLVNNR